MGAGASAASMSVEERREMYEVLRETHTRDDLDALAEEEKQAWLEVVEEDRAGAALAPSNASTSASTEMREGETSNVTTAPAATAAAAAAAAAVAAAAITSDIQVENGDTIVGGGGGGGGGGGLPGGIGGGGSGTIGPQKRKTRLSYYQAPGGQTPTPGGGQEKEAEGGKNSEEISEGENSALPLPSGELPAWKKNALETETPHELCIGDVVRARDTSCGGMWFEGLLTAISDESTFTVELTGKGHGEVADHITVGIDDLVRVMPWFCIEVGDVVECHPKDMMGWVRGKVVRVLHAEALYDVALDGGDSVESNGGGASSSQEAGGGDAYVDMELGVTESAIRKIRSHRQSISMPAVAVQ